MNNFFTSQSTSFLLIMLIIFGISALIKFAVRLFEMLVKLAFVLIILFFGFKAIEFNDTAPETPFANPTPASIDTNSKPKHDTIKMARPNALLHKSITYNSNNPAK